MAASRKSLENMPTKVYQASDDLYDDCAGGLSNRQFNLLLKHLNPCTSHESYVSVSKREKIHTSGFTTGPFCLAQGGHITISLLNNNPRSERQITLRLWDLSNTPKTLLRIGDVGFSKTLTIEGLHVVNVTFDAFIPSNVLLQLEISDCEQIYPAVYLSTQPDLPLQTLFKSSDFLPIRN